VGYPDPKWSPGRPDQVHRYAAELDLGPPYAYGWLAANPERFGFTKRHSWEAWHYGSHLRANEIDLVSLDPVEPVHEQMSLRRPSGSKQLLAGHTEGTDETGEHVFVGKDPGQTATGAPPGTVTPARRASACWVRSPPRAARPGAGRTLVLVLADRGTARPGRFVGGGISLRTFSEHRGGQRVQIGASGSGAVLPKPAPGAVSAALGCPRLVARTALVKRGSRVRIPPSAWLVFAGALPGHAPHAPRLSALFPY
jgi:hypothetical protein